MRRLFYILALLIAAVCFPSCGDAMDGVWTCKKVTIVGQDYDKLHDTEKQILDGNIGATMTFKGSEVVDAQERRGTVDMSKGRYHLSDDQKVLTVNFKKYSYDGGKTWKDVPEGLPADFDYKIVTLDDKLLIFQLGQGDGIVFEYTYEKD